MPRGNRVSATLTITYVRLYTKGWLCVRCGLGRYIAGRCSSCSFRVPAFARLPRQLVKPEARGAA